MMFRYWIFISMLFLPLATSTSAMASDEQTVQTKRDAVNTVERKKQYNIQVQHKKNTAGEVTNAEGTSKKVLPTKVMSDDYLWGLYKSGQFTKLGKLIQQTKLSHPGWLPDAKLERLLFEHKVIRRVSRAIKQQNFAIVLKNYQTQPGVFGCERNQWRLFIAKAYLKRKKVDHALDVYNQILTSCDFTVRFETLEHAAQYLSESEFEIIFKQQKKWALSSTEKKALSQLNQRRLLRLAQQANEKKDNVQALRLANKLSHLLMKTKEAPMLEALAWLYFEQKKFTLALKHFKVAYQQQPSKSALEGMAYTYLQLEKYSELEGLLDAYHGEVKGTGVFVNTLSVLAGQALADKNYEKTLLLLAELKALRALQNSELEMVAWAQYHLKQFSQAAALFEQLYHIQPSLSYAQGLYFSLLQLGQQDKLAALSQKLGGELRRLVMLAKTNNLQTLEQSQAFAVSNDHSPKVHVTQMSRDRSGNFALSRMNLQKRVLAFTMPSALRNEKTKDKILFQYERFDMNLRDGALPQAFAPNQPFNPGFAIGSMQDIGQSNYALPVIQNKHHGYEWSLGYVYDASDATYQLQVGQLVYDAFNLSELKVNASYKHEDDNSMYRLALYKKPLPSSLLSYLGLPDPYKGTEYWGAVSRYGGEATGYMVLPNEWSLSGSVVAESRSGEQVATNEYVSVYTGLSYQFDLSNFLYFTAGPYMRWEHSTMNQNYYTIGHGGYFSPQFLWDKGLSLSFMTATDKSWLVKTSASVGHQNIRQDASPYFPLGSVTVLNAASYPSSVNAELHYQLDISGVFAVNENLRVHASFLRSSSNVGYNESSYMLGLTYYFDQQGSHVSVDDFPAYGLSPLY
ncbi:MAG: BCSC C-terminal domain-containing protein [Alcanivoracaceae bacterium]|nr:BCSC C-terminal domain-containing protein [Alcanivoracaceae bacterium]